MALDKKGIIKGVQSLINEYPFITYNPRVDENIANESDSEMNASVIEAFNTKEEGKVYYVMVNEKGPMLITKDLVEEYEGLGYKAVLIIYGKDFE